MTARAGIARVIAMAVKAADASVVISTDPNDAFDPPDDKTYVEVRFVDGAERLTSISGPGRGRFEAPLLAYTDIRVPLGQGDGEATDLARVVRDALRRLNVDDARWQRFEEGAEGRDGTAYRKQVVAVFKRSGYV